MSTQAAQWPLVLFISKLSRSLVIFEDNNGIVLNRME